MTRKAQGQAVWLARDTREARRFGWHATRAKLGAFVGTRHARGQAVWMACNTREARRFGWHATRVRSGALVAHNTRGDGGVWLVRDETSDGALPSTRLRQAGFGAMSVR